MSTLLFMIAWQGLSKLNYLPDFWPSLAPSDPLHYCCWAQLLSRVLLHLGVTTLLVLELGRQEANRQKAKTGRRAKKRLKTLPSVLNVIVDVQTDTRKPPPPPDGLLDKKGHTLLRTRAQCSPGWPGTRESLFRFCYLRAKQARTFLCSSAPVCFIAPPPFAVLSSVFFPKAGPGLFPSGSL